MKEHMKGDLLDTGIAFVFGLMFIGILLGAGAIAITSMQPSATGAGGGLGPNMTASVFNNGSSSLVNFSTQLPTVGTIAGVGLIIMVLFIAVGAYVFGKKE